MTFDATLLAAGFSAGVAVGLFYFGGLWWTVRRIPTSRRPGLLVLSSFWIRTGVAAAALIPLARIGWPPLVAALAGTLLVRVVAVRLFAPGPRPVRVRRRTARPDERRAA